MRAWFGAMLYKIVRLYKNDHPRRTIASGVTLEEAQAHCSDPETSSSTCTSSAGRARTRRTGEWFDGYDPLPVKRSRISKRAQLIAAAWRAGPYS